jgi:hypothetical protein
VTRFERRRLAPGKSPRLTARGSAPDRRRSSRSRVCSSGCLLQTPPCMGHGCSAIRPSDNRLEYDADRLAWYRHRSAGRHCCGRVDRRACTRSTRLGPVNPRVCGRGLTCLTGLVEDEVRAIRKATYMARTSTPVMMEWGRLMRDASPAGRHRQTCGARYCPHTRSSNVKPARRWHRLGRRGRQTSLRSSRAIGIFAASADRPTIRHGEQHRTRARFRLVLRCEQGASGNDWGDARSYRSLFRCCWSSRLRMERSASTAGAAVRSHPRGRQAEWYAIRSDTKQREKLRSAIIETTSGRWKKSLRAPGDLKWLLDRADKLANDRNNAVHAPCSLYLRGDGSSEVMAAVRSANAGNRRAKNLEGKDLLIEFHWCAAYAMRLGQFAGMLAPAMASRTTTNGLRDQKFHLGRSSPE